MSTRLQKPDGSSNSHGDDRRLTRAIILAYADSMVDGWAGRRARRHLLDAGFENVAVEVDTVPSSR